MKKPETKVMSASEVRQHFAETVNEAAKGNARFVIEKNGAPSAAVVSARDLERLEQEDAQWEADWAFLDGVRAQFADVDPEEFERMAIETVREIREEKRRERAQNEKAQSEAGRVA